MPARTPRPRILIRAADLQSRRVDGPAAVGFFIMIIVVLLARRAAPQQATELVTELAPSPGVKAPRTIGRGGMGVV